MIGLILVMLMSYSGVVGVVLIFWGVCLILSNGYGN